MAVCEQRLHFTDPHQRERAELAFEVFASGLCSEHGRSWEEVASDLRSSGFPAASIPSLIQSAWVAVDPDPSSFTIGAHPARRGEILVPRGVLRLVERYLGSLSHPAGGRGTPSRRLHPLAWIKSRGQGESRSA